MQTARPFSSPQIQSYLKAKAQALQLIKDIELFGQDQSQEYKSIVQDIVRLVDRCQSRERGEVYMLLVQSGIKMKMKVSSLPLPNQYLEAVFSFVSALLQEKVTEKKATTKIYKLKHKSNTERTFFREGKSKLKDLLLIERYDVVLATLINELEEREGSSSERRRRIGMSQECRSFFQNTLRIAEKYLSQQEYQEYRHNILQIVGRREVPTNKVVKKTSTSLFSLSQNYLIIDKSEQSRSSFHFRTGTSVKKPTIISTGQRQSKRSSSSHRSSASRRSIKDDVLKGFNESVGVHLKKNSLMSGNNQIKSRSSNCTLRSSIRINHNFGVDKPMSTFATGFKRVPRSSARLGRSSDLKVMGERVPERKSRFGLLGNVEQEALNQLQEQMNMQRNSSQSSRQEVEATFSMTKKTSRLNPYKSQTMTLFAANQLHPFYIFVEFEGSIYLLTVEQEEMGEGELLQSGQIKSSIRVSLVQNQLQLYLSCELDIECNEEEDISAICQEYLMKHVKINKNNKDLTMTLEGQEIDRRGNCLRIRQVSQTILMGFIRKISTYFIHTSKVVQQFTNCYQYGLRKKLVTDHQTLPFAVPIKSRLMNSDLSMSFQEQETEIVKKGSVIHYIQNQDTSLGAAFRTADTYKLLFEHCALREWEDIQMWKLWISPKVKEEPQQSKRRRGRKYNSKIHKAITADEQSNNSRKLRKVAHNKSSIRIYSPELDSLLQEFELRSTNNSRMLSKRDAVVVSDRKIVKQQVSKVQKNIEKTKKERQTQKRIISFVETVKTDQGYKLIKKTMVQQISGYAYHQYQGFAERNPQTTRFFKNQLSEGDHRDYLQSRITVRGQSNQVINTKLITFIKPLHNNEESFLGYLISDIKILTLSANRCIFIETYWEKMQKHFIFTLSNELFQEITDINTSHFWETPINKTSEKVVKKRQKRTSVMNYFSRDKKEKLGALMFGSSHKTNRINEEEAAKTLHNTRFKDNKTRVGKQEKTAETYVSFSSKTKQKMMYKREILPMIKIRLVRCLTFLWKDHTLNLLIRPIPPSSSNPPLYPQLFQFQGRQLAVKNIYSSKEDPKQASSFELILLRYKENNLTNLNLFTQEGLNQISLEHIFIKNNEDLFGRYQNLLHLSSLPSEVKVNLYYREHNHFFNRNRQSQQKPSNQKHKNTSIMFAGRQEQKRYKYAQILSFAKECCLPFQFVEQKRKKQIKKSFIIPNRYPILGQDQEMLRINIESEFVKVCNLQGGQVVTFSVKKLEQYLPYVRKLNQRQFKTIFQKRVLEDQDIMRLCQITEDDSF